MFNIPLRLLILTSPRSRTKNVHRRFFRSFKSDRRRTSRKKNILL